MSAAKCQLKEAEKKLLKEKQARGVTVVGIDLAARVIQVCYLQKNGTLCNKSKTRDEFIKFLEEPPFTGKILAGIEACGSCNFWARKIKALGHDCKVMPAFQIKAFLSLDTKTDKVDALAILKAVMSVSIKEIGIRDEKNQVLMQLLTVREQLIKQKIQIQNARRAVLYELGEVCSLGENAIDNCAQKLLVSLEEEKKAISKSSWYVREIAEQFIKYGVADNDLFESVIDVTNRAFKQGYAIAMSKVEQKEEDNAEGLVLTDEQQKALEHILHYHKMFRPDLLKAYKKLSELKNQASKLLIALEDIPLSSLYDAATAPDISVTKLINKSIECA